MRYEIEATGSANIFAGLNGGQTIVFDGPGPVRLVLNRPERTRDDPLSLKSVRVHIVIESDDIVLPEVAR